ncbi:MAG: hypothetical protein E7019_00285 [Alphaproteobacteria bacterium]|nr:hypothetical protein [Alphaproteobacteria bacterium]
MFDWLKKKTKSEVEVDKKVEASFVENKVNDTFIDNEEWKVGKKETVETSDKKEKRKRNYKIEAKTSDLVFDLSIEEIFDEITNKGSLKAVLRTGKKGGDFEDVMEFEHNGKLPEHGDKRFSLRKDFLHSLKMKIKRKRVESAQKLIRDAEEAALQKSIRDAKGAALQKSIRDAKGAARQKLIKDAKVAARQKLIRDAKGEKLIRDAEGADLDIRRTEILMSVLTLVKDDVFNKNEKPNAKSLAREEKRASARNKFQHEEVARKEDEKAKRKGNGLQKEALQQLLLGKKAKSQG